MGQQQSQLNQIQEENPYNKTGYHVLQVHSNSPSSGKLYPFFDFIVAANQVVFEKEDQRFSEIFRNNIDKNVHLIVYNIKTDTTREVVITPSTTWGGQGLAGISIRYSSWEKTLETVWHVVDVYLNSPAHDAALETRTDFIVGTPDIIFNEQEDFFTLINNNMYRPIQLYVYSTLTENVRLVNITPNKNWGGSGSLGCDIGYGLLHRIPTKQIQTSQMISPSMERLKISNSPSTQPIANNSLTTPSTNISSPSPNVDYTAFPSPPTSQPIQINNTNNYLTPQKDQSSNNNNNDDGQQVNFDLTEQLHAVSNQSQHNIGIIPNN
ncbi:hypothetical protein CYY_005771 [Polysphondylium violaceum]|uniref:PDZ GRASP-type domain-containing protein n=1 Tax=Polysphondylium violaceum TaxID=133409 RepID=A0A8J4V6J5_9MYCE|nr:hypothetical protein CYY_005771 [Polysphondylium violaceum]